MLAYLSCKIICHCHWMYKLVYIFSVEILTCLQAATTSIKY